MPQAAILPPHLGGLTKAAKLIQEGELVAFPTETVYGLGGDAGNDRAIAAIFAAKERPSFNPLIVHVATLSQAALHAELPPAAVALARRFWPGPLTLVLKRRPDCAISRLASAGMDSLALRVPDHPVARALLVIGQRPIAAPSANRSGRLSPTLAAHVAADLGDRIAAIIDGGPCRIGLESSVVSLIADPPLLLRPGAITPAMLTECLGQEIALAPQLAAGESPLSPGQLASHYAPRAKLRLDAQAAGPGEALLAFGPAPEGERVRNLSPIGDLVTAAANLFAMLHELDQPNIAGIAVMPIPETGLGLAINDRLRRAAAPRD